MTIEEQVRQDQEEMQPIVEEIFLMFYNKKLCYRKFKRMIDMLVHQGSSKFFLIDQGNRQ